MLLRQLSYAIKNQLKAFKVTILGISCLSKCLYGICEGANEGKESVIGALIALKHSKRQEMSLSVISVWTLLPRRYFIPRTEANND